MQHNVGYNRQNCVKFCSANELNKTDRFSYQMDNQFLEKFKLS